METMGFTLDLDKAAEVKVTARAEGVSIAEFMRQVVLARVEELRTDPEFLERLRVVAEQDQAVIDRLRDGPPEPDPEPDPEVPR